MPVLARRGPSMTYFDPPELKGRNGAGYGTWSEVRGREPPLVAQAIAFGLTLWQSSID